MEKMKQRNIKNYIIPIVLSILILGVIGVWAGTTISNNANAYLSADNITINGSGAYLQNGANLNGVSSGTADVVVCRGTSIWDDYYKSIKWMSGCDVVCKSSDTSIQCGTKLNNTIYTTSQNGGGIINVGCGNYSNGNMYVWGASNVKILGHGSCTIFNIDVSDIFLRIPVNTVNFEIGNLAFSSVQSGQRTAIDIGTPPTDNIYIHNIDFGNVNFNSFRFTSGGVTSSFHTNLKIERVKAINSSFIIGQSNGFILSNSYFSGYGVGANTQSDIGYSENGASIYNGKVFLNHFDNNKTTFCIASSNNAQFDIYDNYFDCDRNAIFTALTQATNRTILNINDNYFNVSGSNNQVIYFNIRSPDSLATITNNKFIGTALSSSNIGIFTLMPSIIDNNIFMNISDACIYLKSKSIVSNNKFYNCDRTTTSNRWVSLESSANYSKIIGNIFSSDVSADYQMINIQTGTTNITSLRNTYYGLPFSVPYLFGGSTSGIEENNSCLDDYVYNNYMPSTCSNSMGASCFGITLQKNATSSCKCTGGAWKCWNMV